MRLPVSHVALLAILSLVSACTSSDGSALGGNAAAPSDRGGPAGDYPMIVGEPFTIDGVTWTPADTMNYDQVGHASMAQTADNNISAAHRTLPLPSYAEVTSLDTGRTILVRVERRGPMDNSQLLELSPGAARQLGMTQERLPVRVRRVNPSEPERALLRAGQAAPMRMDTPKSLVAVLSRKLAPVSAPPDGPAAVPTSEPTPIPAPTASSQPVPASTVAPAAPVSRDVVAVPGNLFVQAAAFSSKERAEVSARKLGATVSRSAALWRVRAGPFATRREAEAALARARTAGYNDARILRAD